MFHPQMRRKFRFYCYLGTRIVTVSARPYAKLTAMPVRACRVLLAGVVLLLSSSPSTAQPFEAAGTRAQGMAGAFVAVADDASAVYWNPAGLATGSFFGLVMDRTIGEAVPDGDDRGAETSSWLLALSTPALGLSYYRLRETTVTPRPPDANGEASPTSRVQALVTHHAGATVVQSLTDRVAVGATLKLVRGTAGRADMPRQDASDLLRDASLNGADSTKFDLDVGIIAVGSLARLGLTVRNLLEPAFDTPDAGELHLHRQVRAGVAVSLAEGWLLAADLDFTRTPGAFGDVRNFALGTEARVLPRAFARGGIRLNTAGDAGHQPAVCVGGSFAVFGSLLVDAQVTTGSDRALRGWGLSGRVTF